MPRYATPADYYRVTGETPATDGPTLTALQVRLDAAAVHIARITRLARVDLDVNGIPTNSAIARGYADMTVRQATFWQATGDAEGIYAGYDTIIMGGVHLEKRAGARAGASVDTMTTAPLVLDILATLNILRPGVRH